MNLATTISVFAGGSGSGCRGSNCGRPSVRWRDGATDKWSKKRRFETVPISKVKTYVPPHSKAIVNRYLQRMKNGKMITAPKAEKTRSGMYELTDGHHRYNAAKSYGEKTIRLQIIRDHTGGTR